MADTPTPIAEIDHGPSKFDQFLEKNQKKLVILALMIFLGVLAYVFFKGYTKLQDEKAGALLLEANTEEEYKKVISLHPDTASAGTAAYRIAAMRTSDADAIKALDHFISTYPDHRFVPLAGYQLAQRQINTAKITEATATLNSLVSRENASYILPKATILLGDIALNNNETELAKNLYDEVAELNHPFALEAKRKVIFMNAKQPQIVDSVTKPVKVEPLNPVTPQSNGSSDTQANPEKPEQDPAKNDTSTQTAPTQPTVPE